MLKLPYNGTPVATIDNPSKEEFINLIRLAKPFKVTGSINHWVLLKELSKIKNPTEQCDYLASIVPDKIVNYSVLPSEQKGSFRLDEKLNQNFSFSSKKALFPDFMNHIKRCITKTCSETLYLQASLLMELMDKIEPLNFFKGFIPSSHPLFWIGTGNQFIGLHNDPFRNIIALFCGQKRVILFPPEELPNIYPAPFDKRSGGVISSLIDVFNPDLDKFHLFKKALKKVKIAVINPGEFLYLPPLWWHAVESIGFNVGLNCWFYDDGKINKLYQLYTPAETLTLTLHQTPVSHNIRKKLYRKFTETTKTNISRLKSTSYLDFMSINTSIKYKKLINQACLSQKQKKIWEKWVNIFALWYVFRLKGNPFPTLPHNEFENMLVRYRKNRWKNYLTKIKRKISLFKYKIRHRSDKHGIVP